MSTVKRLLSFMLGCSAPLVLGCGGSAGLLDAAASPPDMVSPSLPPPAYPDLTLADNAAKFDVPGFSAQLSRTWLLIENASTPGDASMRVLGVTPPGVERVDVWIDRARATRLRGVPGRFSAEVDVSTLGPGLHQVAFVADGTLVFARRVIVRTAPLYVIVSCDWDTSDNTDRQLVNMEILRASHPGLVYSHFFGPYTLTDPGLAPARRDQLVAWIKRARDVGHDEIGLHIHPRCTFVPSANLPCRTAPSWQGGSDATGYSVLLPDAYTEAEQGQLIQKSIMLFSDYGLGRPTSFRSGAWAADATTLRALAANGFTVESSSVAVALLQALKGTQLYPYLSAHWPDFTDTSQPYHPSTVHASSSDPAPQLALLEVPDNGALVDYVTAAQMQDIFARNDAGGFFATPHVYQIGFHPPSLSDEYAGRLQAALATVDASSHENDAGAAVYVTLRGIVSAF